MGHSSSQPRALDPQVYAAYPDTDVERKQGSDNTDSSRWLPSSLDAPPPYASVVAGEISGVQHTSPLSAAAAPAGCESSGTSSSQSTMTLPPGSHRTRIFMIHPAFSSRDRLQDIAYLQAPMRRESKENALDILRGYDTVVIMDDSASMLQDRRWERACTALSELAQTATTYEGDGIDIHFLNHPKYGINVKDARSVRKLFRHVRPQGLTPIANKLNILVGDYVEKLENAKALWKRYGDASALERVKPINFIVITDGAPTDEPIGSIVSLARRLDRGNYPLVQVGILFVQIGEDDGATKFMKQLDDDLSSTHGVRDIVDTTPFLGVELSAEVLIKILLGGIHRRVDRRGD